MEDYSRHTVAALAEVVSKDWGVKVYFGAVPYIAAMRDLTSVRDNYISDPGTMIVRYFLSNAKTWRGPVARAVKAELKKRLAEVGKP